MSPALACSVIHLSGHLLDLTRAKYNAMCQAGTDEVRCAMDLGDLLVRVKEELAPKRGCRTLSRNKSASKVASQCIRLAKHRDLIESHLAVPAASVTPSGC
jgi:hypothetical protein